MIRLPMIDDIRATVGRAESSKPALRTWRTLDEFAESPAFRELMEREFPEHPAAWLDSVSRRRFLELMGASLALGGVAGCNTREPAVKIVPYVRKPELMTPGKPLYFASTMPFPGGGFGVLVESHEGRPTKIEGNQQHPASLGATNAFMQASVLGLYDPDRSKALTYLGRIRGWNDAVLDLQKILAGFKDSKSPYYRGKGFRILSESIASPTLIAQITLLLEQFPEARWHQFEPSNTGAVREGLKLAFGEPCDPVYKLSDAMRVVTLDADLFGSGPGHLVYARDFMARRRQRSRDAMNRLYAVESYPTGTGLTADHRLALPPSEIEGFVAALADRFGLLGSVPFVPDRFGQWLGELVDDLRAHEGRSLVVAGETLSPAAHATVAAMNDVLKNTGKTVHYIAPIDAPSAGQVHTLADLVRDIDRNEVQVLLILGGNPAFTAPADVRFAERLSRVPLRIRHGLYDDETSRLCQWHIPEAHYLESWSDCRAYDGTASLIQPLIAPLYGGRTAHEIIAVFGDQPSVPAQEIVRSHWQRELKDTKLPEPFDRFWRRCLHDGVIPNTASPPRSVALKEDWKAKARELRGAKHETIEIVFHPDPTIHDGRFANNAWLQELPKPVSKLTWDNAAIVSPATAAKLGVKNTLGMHGGSHGETIADTADVVLGDRTLAGIPVLILPGHADDCATLHYGYGRTTAGRVGSNTGFNVYSIRTSSAMSHAGGATLRPTGRPATLACTQSHHAIKSEEAAIRGLVRTAPLEEYLREPHFAAHEHHHDGPLPTVGGVPQKPPQIGRLPNDMYPAFPYDGYKWGMVIDLSSCIGCGGCVVACQAENNIPVVGKEQVTRGHEMHWLRIDQYHQGDPNDSSSIHTVFEPMACHHCENAPCEVVCPVEATVHSPDGLNEMVYNRCVGTRYCSNNCPYKVRRFNFLLYADYATESLKLQRNPEVTTRSRGVMEKCTFCVQRIRNAEIHAKNEGRTIRDGEVVTACQAACPTQAIIFGDMNDPSSQVRELKGSPLQFGAMSELNTRPRLTYQAVVRNPNPKLAEGAHG